jgi:peptidoglycan/xylan/chitin deacetylase (PgdA/CDA1 family)
VLEMIFKKIFYIIYLLLFSGIPFLSEPKDKETIEKAVYMTLDDGPTVYTKDFLNILNQEGIKATFFLVGNKISYQNSNIIIRMSHCM